MPEGKSQQETSQRVPRQAVRQRPVRRGWDPREPILIAAALALLIVAGVFYWWRFETETFTASPPLITKVAVEFGPWLVTHWYTIISGGPFAGFYVEATPLPWWAFSEAYPRHAAYASVTGFLSALWSSTLALLLFALWARLKPRKRMGGWPTVAQVMAGILVITAALVAILGFPAAGGFPSFAGASTGPTLTWGPGIGFYAILGAFVATLFSSGIGWEVDRRMAGLCWSCLSPVSGPKCGFCGSIQ